MECELEGAVRHLVQLLDPLLDLAGHVGQHVRVRSPDHHALPGTGESHRVLLVPAAYLILEDIKKGGRWYWHDWLQPQAKK